MIINRPPNKEGKQNYDTIPLVAWGVHAENLAKYTAKGKEMAIIGEIRTNNVKKPDGSWQNFFEVMVKEVSFGRDSTAAKIAKATEASELPTASLAAEVANLLKHPDFAERLSKMKASAKPEVVLAPVSPMKVEAAVSLAENPFNE